MNSGFQGTVNACLDQFCANDSLATLLQSFEQVTYASGITGTVGSYNLGAK